MNEEELFCKLFPEYAVNGKPLSPYFDFFESGVEQTENRIEELEEKLKHAEENCINKSCVVLKDKEECVAQLINAKEIIKKYLTIGVGGKITQNYLDVTKEAEQFLSEVEK